MNPNPKEPLREPQRTLGKPKDPKDQRINNQNKFENPQGV